MIKGRITKDTAVEEVLHPFVESLFLYATIVTKKNQYAIGTLFGGLFFSGFYLGSIYGAEQFAKKKMKNLYKKYFDKLIFDYHY